LTLSKAAVAADIWHPSLCSYLAYEKHYDRSENRGSITVHYLDNVPDVQLSLMQY